MFAQLMGLKTISPGDLHQLMQREHITAIRREFTTELGRTPRVPAREASPSARVTPDHDLPTDLDAPLIFYSRSSLPEGTECCVLVPRAWAIATCASCRRASAAGSMPMADPESGSVKRGARLIRSTGHRSLFWFELARVYTPRVFVSCMMAL